MDDRVEPPYVADELQTLLGFLEFYRGTLQVKCTGLSHEQLRSRAVPPSNLSLLGLVRHMADVERIWFRIRIAGEDLSPRYWGAGGDGDADFNAVDDADVDEAFAAWREEMDHARRITAEHALDDTFRHGNRGDISIRWVLVHLVEEYARHAGHADFLRECIDGATGD